MQLLAVSRHHEERVVNGQSKTHRCSEVEGEDRDVGERVDHLEDGEGAENSKRADEEGEAGGDQPAEHEHEKDQSDRDSDQLGPLEVSLDGRADLTEHLGLPGHLHLQRCRGIGAGEYLGELLDAFAYSVLVTGDTGEDQGLGSVV